MNECKINGNRRREVRLLFMWWCLLLLPSGGWGMAQITPPIRDAADSVQVVFSGVLYFSRGNADWIEQADYLAVGRFLRAVQHHPGLMLLLKGWADTTGTTADNCRIAERRAAAVGRYLVRKGIDPARIRIESCGEDATVDPSFARRVEMYGIAGEGPTGRASSSPTRTKGKQADSTTDSTGEKRTDSKEKPVPPPAIKSGSAMQPVNRADTAGTIPPPEHQPKQQIEPKPEQYPQMEPALPGKKMPSPGRYLDIKTNIATWTGNLMNIAADVQVGEHLSVELPILWCPWHISDRHAVKTFAIQPEARYWLSRPGEGHFFGVHAHVGWFNVKWNRDRYQDADRPLFGAGISYGYLLPFSEHWAGEFTLGAGYANMRYDTYYNIDNGAHIDTRTKNYWGITRVGLSVVYRFNL